MFVSERFLGRLAKLRKAHRQDPQIEQIGLVRDAFTGMMSGLPGPMIEEIFELFVDRIVDRIAARAGDDAIFLDEARYLADVADLFSLQYDEKNDPLHPDDWELVGDIVNDYALDLDMDTVNYVMRLVVDHHGV